MKPNVFLSIVYNSTLLLYHSNTKLARKTKNLYRRLLNGTSKDSSIVTRVNRQLILCPYTHKLPIYQKEYPLYDRQLARLCKYMKKTTGRKISIIDVGANIGDTVINIGIKDASYLCIEGNEYFSKYINHNLKKYDYTIERYFLTDKPQEKNFVIESANGTGKLRYASCTKTSNLCTLDELTEQKYQDFCPDLLKIDTDGFDFKVIRGAKQTLQKWHPMLFFEWDKAYCEEQKENMLAIFPLLKELGYSTCILFDNYGNYFDTVDVSDTLLLKKHIENTLGSGLPYYYDVLAVHSMSEITGDALTSLFAKPKNPCFQ